MKPLPAWLVFYGTLTTVVRAASEGEAYLAFLAANNPASMHGRYVPPTRDEVTIRRPRESDRDWIMESSNMDFVRLLAELPSTASH